MSAPGPATGIGALPPAHPVTTVAAVTTFTPVAVVAKPAALPCPTCLDLVWDNFPEEQPGHHPIQLSARRRDVTLTALIRTRKQRCQLCFAICRAIDLFLNLDPGLRNWHEHMIAHKSQSKVILFLRPNGLPLEVFALLRNQALPPEPADVQVVFEMYTDPGECCVVGGG